MPSHTHRSRAITLKLLPEPLLSFDSTMLNTHYLFNICLLHEMMSQHLCHWQDQICKICLLLHTVNRDVSDHICFLYTPNIEDTMPWTFLHSTNIYWGPSLHWEVVRNRNLVKSVQVKKKRERVSGSFLIFILSCFFDFFCASTPSLSPDQLFPIFSSLIIWEHRKASNSSPSPCSRRWPASVATTTFSLASNLQEKSGKNSPPFSSPQTNSPRIQFALSFNQS